MIQAIVVILFAVPIAIFATQNTGVISLHFLGERLENVPVYLAAILALLAGVLFSSIIHLVYRLGTSLTIHDLHNEVKIQRRKSAEILKHVHQLELENEELKKKNKNETVIDKKSL